MKSHNTLDKEIIPKKLYIKTYGCQMNVYDSIYISNLMRQHGYRECDTPNEADLIIFNTCHIREKAAEKVYSEIGKLKKIKKNNSIVILAGCVAQAEGDIAFNKSSIINFIVGPQNIHKIPEMIESNNSKSELEFPIISKFDHITNNQSTDVRHNKSSAFITIQEGCDKFCTFCVVPYTRGPEYSRPAEDIIREALLLAESGVKEIILLGQNVNAYHGTYNNNQIFLGDLIIKLSEIHGIKRIRYITSHPSDMHKSLYDAHKDVEQLMPFIHLPVQSGSDKILKKMNRKYSYAEYIKIIEKLSQVNNKIKLSSDIIVGFPGETDEDFKQTINLVNEVQYIQCFSFKYSPRPGTPGASMENAISEKVKHERLLELQEILNKNQYNFNKQMIGSKIKVLCSGLDAKNPQYLVGKTEYYQTVRFKTNNTNILLNANTMKNIFNVKITNAYHSSLDGELIE